MHGHNIQYVAVHYQGGPWNTQINMNNYIASYLLGTIYALNYS